MRAPGVEQRTAGEKNESGRQKGNEAERERGIQRRGNAERKRERRGGERNLWAPPFRMQIQEHLEAKVACKSALCSHLIGARAAAPRANTCFLQPLKIVSLSAYFSSSSSSPSPLFVFPSRDRLLLLFIGSRFRETPIDRNIFSRDSRDGVGRRAVFADKRNDFHGKYQNRSGSQRVETREREKKATAEAQFIKFFPLAWFETPRSSTATTPPSPLIRERVSPVREGGGGKNLRQRWKQQIRSPARESTIETINSPCVRVFFFSPLFFPLFFFFFFPFLFFRACVKKSRPFTRPLDPIECRFVPICREWNNKNYFFRSIWYRNVTRDRHLFGAIYFFAQCKLVNRARCFLHPSLLIAFRRVNLWILNKFLGCYKVKLGSA